MNISVREVKDALERLIRLGFLKKNASGRLECTGVAYHTTDGVTDVALQRAHFQNLELARESLEQDTIENRDFTAMTMAIDPDRLPEAKRRIRDFRSELCRFLESGKRKEVFKLCMQLIPLTKKEEASV